MRGVRRARAGPDAGRPGQTPPSRGGTPSSRSGVGAGHREGGQDVHAPALGVLVGDDRSHTAWGPGVGGGQGGAETGFVEAEEVQLAVLGLFLSPASAAPAAVAGSGSCRWRPLACVRRQRAPIRFRYIRTVRGLRWMSSSVARASARVVTVQGRGRPSRRSRASSIRCRRARSGGKPVGCGWRGRQAPLRKAVQQAAHGGLAAVEVGRQLRDSSGPRPRAAGPPPAGARAAAGRGTWRRSRSAWRWSGVSEACRGADMAGPEQVPGQRYGRITQPVN